MIESFKLATWPWLIWLQHLSSAGMPESGAAFTDPSSDNILLFDQTCCVKNVLLYVKRKGQQLASLGE